MASPFQHDAQLEKASLLPKSQLDSVQPTTMSALEVDARAIHSGPFLQHEEPSFSQLPNSYQQAGTNGQWEAPSLIALSDAEPSSKPSSTAQLRSGNALSPFQTEIAPFTHPQAPPHRTTSLPKAGSANSRPARPSDIGDGGHPQGGMSRRATGYAPTSSQDLDKPTQPAMRSRHDLEYAREYLQDEHADAKKSRGCSMSMRTLRRLLALVKTLGAAAATVLLIVKYHQLGWDGVELWRVCLFVALFWPLYYLPNYAVYAVVAAVEAKLFSVGPAVIYYIMGLKTPVTHFARAASWLVLVHSVFESEHWGDKPRQYYDLTIKTWGCVVMFFLARVLAALVTKLLSRHFHSRSHFQRMQDAVKKEYFLLSLSQPRLDDAFQLEPMYKPNTLEQLTQLAGGPAVLSSATHPHPPRATADVVPPPSSAAHPHRPLASGDGVSPLSTAAPPPRATADLVSPRRSQELPNGEGNAPLQPGATSEKLPSLPDDSGHTPIRVYSRQSSGALRSGPGDESSVRGATRCSSPEAEDGSVRRRHTRSPRESIDEAKEMKLPETSDYELPPAGNGRARRGLWGNTAVLYQGLMNLDKILREPYQRVRAKVLPPGVAAAEKVAAMLPPGATAGQSRDVMAGCLYRLERHIRKNKLRMTLTDQLGDLESGQVDEINNKSEARKMALFLYWHILPPHLHYNRADIILDDLHTFLCPAEAAECFQLLDTDKDGRISFADMREAVLRIYRERKHLASTLRDTKSVVGRLQGIASAVFHVIFIFFYLSIFQVNLKELWISFSSVTLAFVFVFGNSLRTIYEAVLFLFMVHPFDVGDHILINDVMMKVEEISLISCTFLKMDGHRLMYPNTKLMTDAIINITRSDPLWESVYVILDIDTPASILERLEVATKQLFAAHPGEYTGAGMVLANAIDSPLKLKVGIFWEYSHTGEDSGRRLRWRSPVVLKVQEVLKEAGVGYSLPPQGQAFPAMSLGARVSDGMQGAVVAGMQAAGLGILPGF